VIAALVLGVLALACLLFVALPLVRPPGRTEVVPAATPAQRERIELRERRDAAYAALRELELEHRTGKLTDEDYARARAELRAEALEVLRLLGDDEPAGREAPPPDLAQEIEATRLAEPTARG
jgi:hypothetical protein